VGFEEILQLLMDVLFPLILGFLFGWMWIWP